MSRKNTTSLKSMRIRVALVMMAIFIVVTLTYFFLSLALIRISITDVIEKELLLALDIADTVVTTKIELLKSNAETISVRLMDLNPQDMEDVMAAQLEEFTDFTSLTVFDRNGIVKHCGATAASTVSPNENQYMQSAFDGMRILSSPQLSDENGDLVMHVFIPMNSDMILSATIPGMLFSDILSHFRLWQTGSIFIIDAEGTFVASHNELYPNLVSEQRNFIIEAQTAPEMKTAGNLYQDMISTTEPGVGQYFFEGKERLCVYKYVTNSIVGWRIGVAAPLAESPQSNVQSSLMLATVLFLAIGIIISIFVSFVAVKPFAKIESQNQHLEVLNATVQEQAAQIRDEHERIKLLLDATPLACHLWSRDFKIFECNKESVELFSLSSSDEFMERYFELSPEFQPDGRLSYDTEIAILKEAFDGKSIVFEWLHQKLDGTPILCETTLVRVRYGGDYVVAGYTRDLRDHKKMMGEIERRDRLLTTGNGTAAILLSMKNEVSIESALMQSMELVGLSADVDRVQLWRNEMIDGSLHFVNAYQWLSDVGKEKASVPIGLSFSYDDKPKWEELFRRGESINGPVSALAPDDRAFLETYDMKTIVIIPLFLQDAFWGFFSIDDCRQERSFTDEEIEILRSVGLMMLNAFNRSTQAAKILEANEYTELLLEAMPYSCSLWDNDNNLFKCNEGSVRMFEAGSKQEYIDHFYEFSPEFQPDGQQSFEKFRELVKIAFEKGTYIGEWMHQKRDGTPIPTVVTLVRIVHGNNYIVAAYVRDLRVHNQMIDAIKRNSELLYTVNQMANILLQSESDGFEDDLHQCMGMIGKAVVADRVCIWKNKTKAGKLYCDLVYDWPGGADSMINRAEAIDVSYDENTPGWEEILSKGKCINTSISRLSPQEQAQLRAHGVMSFFVAPVFVQNEFWGYVGFDDYKNEKIFSENEASTLYSGSLLIANALVRNEMVLNLRDANKAKSDFLAKISHEMRTPLNAVIGLSALALEDEAVNEETRLNIEKVSNAGELLLSTVNDILDISKIEAGKLELMPVKYDVPSLINDTITQSVMYIGEKPIVFILDINETLPAQLYGDDLRIKQILNNLLSNAFRYTREGAVELGILCEKGVEDEETVWMTVYVRDTGIGIKPEEIDTLFGEFVQADTQTNRHIVGTGLGLSITKKMAELMDGSITVESEYEKGSTFTIRLRQRFVTDQCIGPEVVENLKSLRYSDHKRRNNSKMVRPRLPYAHVLVVDDNITNLDVVKGLMKPYGMQIDCVTSGQEAIDAILFEAVHYNAVFMDHMMPGMDGIKATGLIRKIGTEYAKTVPIIACTANAIVGSEQMFLDNGFQDFISKPIDVGHLDEIMRRWVRDKEQEKSIDDCSDNESAYLQNDQEHRVISSRRSGIDRRKANMDLTGLDVDKGVERFGGDRETYFKILHSYMVHTRPLLDSIKDVTEEQLADYAIAVHGIKGASRGIYADIIGSAAENLEKAAKAGDFIYVITHNDTFLNTVWKLIFDLENLLSNLNTGNPKPIKDKPDEETLSRLLEACKSYNMDSVDDAMAEIENYQYDADDGLVSWLIDNIRQMRFKKIVERLSKQTDKGL